jgi:hypothetical protein
MFQAKMGAIHSNFLDYIVKQITWKQQCGTWIQVFAFRIQVMQSSNIENKSKLNLCNLD